MKTKSQLPILGLFALLGSVAAFGSSPNQWEEISNDDGIIVHRMEFPDSDIVAFKGEAVVNAPIAKVANILIDTKRKLEWVADIKEARNIRQIGEYERVEYNHTGTPWPIRDRDFVFHAKVELDRDKKTMWFKLHSVEDAAVPELSPVRGELKDSQYALTSIENDTKTRVVVEIQADPKGSIPKWLVNLTQKKWPRKTLTGIQNQAAKPDVVEHPAVRAYFAAPAAMASVASVATPSIAPAPTKTASASPGAKN